MNTHSIIYVMRHIDIGGHIEIPYKKVGMTGKGNATLSTRLQQISNTKSPIQAQCIAAWEYHDAGKLETALHSLLMDQRVEGEWFYDQDDTLVERMEPIMNLIGAKKIVIEQSDDSHTRNIIQREKAVKEAKDHRLLGEISELINSPLKSGSRIEGPTFWSSSHDLTYYVNARASGFHNLGLGRSKAIISQLRAFLEKEGYTTEVTSRGECVVIGLELNQIAEAINKIETLFKI